MAIVNVGDQNIDGDGRIFYTEDIPFGPSTKKKQLTRQAWSVATYICSSSKKLKYLEDLPKSVKTISLAGCSAAQDIGGLTPDIETIDLAGCLSLKKLPDLSQFKKLKFLNLTRCKSLEITEEFLQTLQDLESQGCKITYPNDEEKIKEAKSAIEKIDAKKLSSTKKLLTAYLTENLDDREKEVHLAENINLFLGLLKPEHYEWVENIASIFVEEGCINQPVAGFFEIISWLEVASKTTDEEKLKALDPLIINASLLGFSRSQEFINNYGKVGKETEAEFINILLGKVCREIFTETTQSPHGVPQKVAYEGSVDSLFKNEHLIKDACAYVAGVRNNPLQFQFEYLVNKSEGSLGVWGEINFPKEIQEVKKQNSARRSEIANSPQSDDAAQTGTDFMVQENSQIADTIFSKTMQLIDRIFPQRPSSSCCPKITNCFQHLIGMFGKKGDNLDGKHH
jgi:hypothetical protein